MTYKLHEPQPFGQNHRWMVPVNPRVCKWSLEDRMRPIKLPSNLGKSCCDMLINCCLFDKVCGSLLGLPKFGLFIPVKNATGCHGSRPLMGLQANILVVYTYLGRYSLIPGHTRYTHTISMTANYGELPPRMRKLYE